MWILGGRDSVRHLQILGGRVSEICGSGKEGQCQTSTDPGREGK